jgi:UDP-N-acetylmuramyl tripeptide synthase
MSKIILNIDYYLDIYDWIDHTDFIKENCLFFFIKPSMVSLEKQQDRINFIFSKLPNIKFFLCPVDIKSMDYPKNIQLLPPLTLEEYQYLVEKKYYLKPKKIIGITGSSGKTSTVNFLYQTYINNKKKASYIASNNCSININNYKKEHPISYLCFHEFLHKSFQNDCEIAILECTNYTIQQQRIKYIQLDLVIFTSFAEDHQDVHHSFLDYFMSKVQLINFLKPDGIILINNNISFFHSLLPLIKQKVFLINNLLDFHNVNLSYTPNNQDNNFFIFFQNNQVKINNDWLIPVDNWYNFLQINNIIIANIGYFLLENSISNNYKYEIIDSRFEIFENKKNHIISILDYSHSIEKVKYFINMIKKSMNIFFPSRKIIVLSGIGSKEINQRFERILWLTDHVDYLVVSLDNIYGNFDVDKYINKLQEYSNVTFITNRQEAVEYIFKKYGNEKYILCFLGLGSGSTLIYQDKIIKYNELQLIKDLIK